MKCVSDLIFLASAY